MIIEIEKYITFSYTLDGNQTDLNKIVVVKQRT
jgi:hypothetical protein